MVSSVYIYIYIYVYIYIIYICVREVISNMSLEIVAQG